jgi:predicted RNase H-like nuclease
VIEVYPHPALVELASAGERLCYKASKVGSYWPSDTPERRRELLYREWNHIVTLLEGQITGVSAALPMPSQLASGLNRKAYEDMLDAIVCCWVAVCALEGRAIPFGDESSAIWIPRASAAFGQVEAPVAHAL